MSSQSGNLVASILLFQQNWCSGAKVVTAAIGMVWNVLLLATSLVCSLMTRPFLVELVIRLVSSDLNIA